MFTQDELNAVSDLKSEAEAFVTSGDVNTAATGRRFYIVAHTIGKIIAALLSDVPVNQPVIDDNTSGVKADAEALITEDTPAPVPAPEPVPAPPPEPAPEPAPASSPVAPLTLPSNFVS